MSSPGWLTELDTMGRQLHALRADVKVIVGGDFNATYDHFAFRQILTGGFADAVDQAGGGWLPTWREGHWYTRLIGIDHVLTPRRDRDVGEHRGRGHRPPGAHRHGGRA